MNVPYNSELHELRGYVFVNRALSSIQKGVQGAHAIVELFNNDHNDLLYEWSSEDKTLIFLDCGFHQEILDNYTTFSLLCDKLDLPHALFHEDEETMNTMATAFAGIIPSSIYEIDLLEYERQTRTFYSNSFKTTKSPPYEDDPPEIQLCRFLSQFKLAN